MLDPVGDLVNKKPGCSFRNFISSEASNMGNEQLNSLMVSERSPTHRNDSSPKLDVELHGSDHLAAATQQGQIT